MSSYTPTPDSLPTAPLGAASMEDASHNLDPVIDFDTLLDTAAELGAESTIWESCVEANLDNPQRCRQIAEKAASISMFEFVISIANRIKSRREEGSTDEDTSTVIVRMLTEHLGRLENPREAFQLIGLIRDEKDLQLALLDLVDRLIDASNREWAAQAIEHITDPTQRTELYTRLNQKLWPDELEDLTVY